jgi:energy-converting hydrogenase Eha subunit F
LLDNLAGKINAVLGPFAKLLEFSQRFAETESQRRIEPRLIPQTINPDSIFKKPAPQILISNNFNGVLLTHKKRLEILLK